MRFASLSAVLVVAPLLVPQPAIACSKGGLSAPLRERMVYFTGTATPDTLRTGPGGVRYGMGGGHFGRAVEREIYGQVVAVDALGGDVEGLAHPVEEVVVVPWDYDPSCRPLVWGRSARWVEPGTAAFYVAELRAPEQWVDGKPTVDLHNPGHLPYTESERVRDMRSTEIPLDSMLTPVQLFDLYRALPTAEEVEAEGIESLGRLRQWIERNPELAQLQPSDRLVASVVAMADREELTRRGHPAQGTWRFDIRLPDGSARTVYGRTDPRSVERCWRSREVFRWTPEEILPPAPEGVTQLMTFADAIDALPDAVQPGNFTRGSMCMLSSPDSSASQNDSWAGRLDYAFLTAALGPHPAVHQVFLEQTRRHRAIYLAGSPYPTPATFTRGPDGMLTVRQSYPLPDGKEVVVEGEQLSRQVLTEPP